MNHPDSPEYQATKSTGQHYEPPYKRPVKLDDLTPEQEAHFDWWWGTEIAPRFEGARNQLIAVLGSLEFDDDFMRYNKMKSRKGRVEHGGDIETMPMHDLQRNLMDELHDALDYVAEIRRRLDQYEANVKSA